MPEDGKTQFVDYVKLRVEEDSDPDDRWWYEEFSNNHQAVGGSDEGYSSKGNALRAIRAKYGDNFRVIDTDGAEIVNSP